MDEEEAHTEREGNTIQPPKKGNSTIFNNTMNLHDIIHSEINHIILCETNQTQKGKFCMIPLK